MTKILVVGLAVILAAAGSGAPTARMVKVAPRRRRAEVRVHLGADIHLGARIHLGAALCSRVR